MWQVISLRDDFKGFQIHGIIVCFQINLMVNNQYMKTSKLIAVLKEIEKSAMFDADVVTGDDWLSQRVTKVYHDAPHTFIEFESFEEDEWSEDLAEQNRKATIKELAIRAHMLQQVIEMSQQNSTFTVEEIVGEIEAWKEKMDSILKALKGTLD